MRDFEGSDEALLRGKTFVSDVDPFSKSWACFSVQIDPPTSHTLFAKLEAYTFQGMSKLPEPRQNYPKNPQHF